MFLEELKELRSNLIDELNTAITNELAAEIYSNFKRKKAELMVKYNLVPKQILEIVK
jgi:hypothetical protein